MASLLSKFRIDYSALKMISDITKKPKDSTLAYFDKLIAPFRTEDSNDACECKSFFLLRINYLFTKVFKEPPIF